MPDQTGSNEAFQFLWGQTGAKRDQMGPNQANWGKTVSNGTNLGQTWTAPAKRCQKGLNRAKQGQTGPNRPKQGQTGLVEASARVDS